MIGDEPLLKKDFLPHNCSQFFYSVTNQFLERISYLNFVQFFFFSNGLAPKANFLSGYSNIECIWKDKSRSGKLRAFEIL